MIRRCTAWCRRHLLIILPYLLVVAIFAVGLHVLEGQSHQRCIERRDDRTALRQVVVISTQGTGASGVDLTKIDGFDDLDPQTQDYLRALSAAISSSNPASRTGLRDQLLEQLPPITC